MKQTITISLENDVVKNLNKYAKELKKSKTELIENAIELYLDELVADKRIDNLKDGTSSVVSMDEVFQKAGIDL